MAQEKIYKFMKGKFLMENIMDQELYTMKMDASIKVIFYKIKGMDQELSFMVKKCSNASM